MNLQLAENARTSTAAAIRRATFAAHKDVDLLDAAGLKRLEQVYKQAASEISARIAAHAGADGNIALQELQSTLRQVNGVLSQLSAAKNTIVQQGLVDAANLGVRPFTAANGLEAVISTEASIAIPTEALTFVRSFVARDGLQLADRLYRLDLHAQSILESRIQQAVIQGHSASQAAQDFIGRGLQVPPELRAKIGDASADALAKKAGADLLKGPGAPIDNAKRLFRTEINRAHGEAYMKAGAAAPGFAGWRYLLSPAHPEPDICDLLSAQNLYGLGPGVYPTREKTPWPAHPNTLSFIVIVFEDEITDKDKAGKETPLEALQKLSDAKKRGVLGEGKLQLLQSGKLTQGMIRTPLSKALTRATALDTAKENANKAAAAAAAKKAAAAAKAAEKAKQAAAKLKVEQIAAAKKGFDYQALQVMNKAGTAAALKPAELLEQIAINAVALKLKKATGDALSKYKQAVLAGKNPPPAAQKVFAGLPDPDKQAFIAKIEAAKLDAAKAAAAAGELRYADLERIGAQRGSNPGGVFRNKFTGEEWYVKTPASGDIARNELLAARLYQAAGVEVPELRLVDVAGKAGIASRMVSGLQADAALLRKGTVPGAADGFAIDAWLGNWDVVGAGFDNLLIKDGRAFRVDVGGALRYRAQGTAKGKDWGPVVHELQTLRNPQTNPQTAAVFRNLTDAQLKASAARLQGVSDDDIRRLVKDHGPLDAKENALLADTLIARKQDILRRVEPEAAPLPLPADAGARITAAEQRVIGESRLNGYTILTDKGDIEDQHVLVWIEKAPDGSPRTVAQFKTTGGATKKLDDLLAASGADVRFDDKGVHASFVEAIKGIATQATKGEALRDKDLERASAAGAALKKLLKATDDLDARSRIEKHFAPWLRAIDEAVAAGEGKPAAWRPPAKKNLAAYVSPPSKPMAGALAFEKRSGDFERKRVERGYAFATDETNFSTGHLFEADLGGAKVRYWPAAPEVPFALRNQVQVVIAGEGEAASSRVFEAIERLGVNSARATALDREELYLRQIAYHRREAFASFEAIAEKEADQGARIAAMKGWLAEKIGREVDASPLYRPAGTYQAFGQGRAQTFRPDLEGKDWEKFQRDYVLYHKVTQGDVVSSIDAVLNSGGQFAPTADKLRRGIPIGGMSPTADLDSGGASYFFTRIGGRGKAGASRADLIWKPRLLARLDSISYGSDMFGRTTGNTVMQSRRTGIDEWRAAARSGSNETVFKNGISIFDDLEHIIVDAPSYDRLLAVFRKHGYTAWPDGRALEEVIKRRGSV